MNSLVDLPHVLNEYDNLRQAWHMYCFCYRAEYLTLLFIHISVIYQCIFITMTEIRDR